LIKYLKNKEIDIVKWDQCINKSFNGNVYALSWYLDIVHDGWEALVENDYERVMPLTVAKKFGVDYMFQPYFTQQLGIFSIKKLNPDVIKKFIHHIPLHIKYININLNSFNKPKGDGQKIVANKNHIQDLIKEYPDIAKKYSTNTKRNLQKSLKHKLSLMKNVKPELVIELFKENKGKKLARWNDTHYQNLNRLMYSAMYKGRGLVYGVFTEKNELCAGAFFVKSNNRLVFLFSGSNTTARENHAMTFLIDSVIREFSRSQLVLDFEGSNDVNLARFYKGFGAKEIEYMGIEINRLTFPFRQLFDLYKLFR
jgi:hypothetical protein